MVLTWSKELALGMYIKGLKKEKNIQEAELKDFN